MRWLGFVVGLCLLFAGAAPKRAIHEYQRPHDEVAAAHALAKPALRRHDGTRPLGTIGLDPVVPASATDRPTPPQTCVELVHRSPALHWQDAHESFDARGPPIA